MPSDTKTPPTYERPAIVERTRIDRPLIGVKAS